MQNIVKKTMKNLTGSEEDNSSSLEDFNYYIKVSKTKIDKKELNRIRNFLSTIKDTKNKEKIIELINTFTEGNKKREYFSKIFNAMGDDKIKLFKMYANKYIDLEKENTDPYKSLQDFVKSNQDVRRAVYRFLKGELEEEEVEIKEKDSDNEDKQILIFLKNIKNLSRDTEEDKEKFDNSVNIFVYEKPYRRYMFLKLKNISNEYIKKFLLKNKEQKEEFISQGKIPLNIPSFFEIYITEEDVKDDIYKNRKEQIRAKRKREEILPVKRARTKLVNASENPSTGEITISKYKKIELRINSSFTKEEFIRKIKFLFQGETSVKRNNFINLVKELAVEDGKLTTKGETVKKYIEFQFELFFGEDYKENEQKYTRKIVKSLMDSDEMRVSDFLFKASKILIFLINSRVHEFSKLFSKRVKGLLYKAKKIKKLEIEEKFPEVFYNPGIDIETYNDFAAIIETEIYNSVFSGLENLYNNIYPTERSFSQKQQVTPIYANIPSIKCENKDRKNINLDNPKNIWYISSTDKVYCFRILDIMHLFDNEYEDVTLSERFVTHVNYFNYNKIKEEEEEDKEEKKEEESEEEDFYIPDFLEAVNNDLSRYETLNFSFGNSESLQVNLTCKNCNKNIKKNKVKTVIKNNKKYNTVEFCSLKCYEDNQIE